MLQVRASDDDDVRVPDRRKCFVFESVLVPKTSKPKWVWGVDGVQRKHGDGGHLVPKDHRTSNGTYCLARDHAPKIHLVGGGGDIDPGERIAVVAAGGPEVEDRLGRADRSVAARAG